MINIILSKQLCRFLHTDKIAPKVLLLMTNLFKNLSHLLWIHLERPKFDFNNRILRGKIFMWAIPINIWYWKTQFFYGKLNKLLLLWNFEIVENVHEKDDLLIFIFSNVEHTYCCPYMFSSVNVLNIWRHAKLTYHFFEII